MSLYTYIINNPPYQNNTITVPSGSDGAVSVQSQRGDVLGDLINEKYDIDVAPGNGIFGVPHSQQIKVPEFQDIVKRVNHEQKE